MRLIYPYARDMYDYETHSLFARKLTDCAMWVNLQVNREWDLSNNVDIEDFNVAQRPTRGQ